MRMFSTLALGAALTLAALPAFAQTSGSGSGSGSSTTPGVTAPNSGTGSGASTNNSATQAPPASATPAPEAGSGSRALRPGQNPDGTPREQSPGNAPQLPGMKGQN